MMRFVTLLATAPGRSADLAECVEREALGVESHLDGRGQVRRAFSIGSERSTFDAVLEVAQLDDGDLEIALEAFDGLASRLGNVVDPARSAAIVGTEQLIVEGMGSIQIHACLTRVPSLTREAFQSFWRNEFAPAARLAPHMAGYRQVHTIAGATKDAARAAGVALDDFDGLAVEWFDSSEGLQEASAWSNGRESHLSALLKFSIDGMLLSQNPWT